MQKLKIVFISLFVLTIYSCNQERKLPPMVTNGIINLVDWDFEKDGTINLDGEWEFYNDRLLTPLDFKTGILQPTTYLKVPGIWNEVNKNREHPGYGNGTYRLVVKLNRKYRVLGLKIMGAASSYKLWIGNQLIAANGEVSSDFMKMKPQYLPLTKYFHPDSTNIEIVVQVSNGFHAKGGLWDYLAIGTDVQLAFRYDRSKFFDWFLNGVMFILFVYNLGIYLFRNREKAALWFALTCLALMLRAMITGERHLFYLFPDFDFNIGLRLEYLTLCISGALYGQFLYHVFKEDFPKRSLNIVLGINGISMAIVFFTPTFFYTSCLGYFQVVLIGQCIYLFGIVSPRSVIRKRHGSLPLLIGLACLSIAIVNDVLFSSMIITSTYIIPFGFFITVLAQAYILASRFSKAFGTIEDLSVELTSANKNLEQKVIERTQQLSIEKQKSDDLLHNILPEEVADELKLTGETVAKQYNNVTVLFTDFVNFTGISEQLSPTELVQEIHKNFTAFDAITEKHGLEKIKTIGDAYLAVCGLPNETINHAQQIVKAALDIQTYIKQNEGKFQIRIGISSGPVVAGIVGVKKYAYDIWGDTVNTAARMEQNSEAGKINISGTTYELVKDYFTCEYRGKVNAKNKGEIDMYFVTYT